MEAMSDRHQGDLGGRLTTFDNRKEVVVRIRVSPDLARYPAAQHTVWMLVNLLTRTDGIVSGVLLNLPRVPAINFTVPFGDHPELGPRIVQASELIQPGRVHLDDGSSANRTITIGTTASDDITVLGAGWWGGITVSDTSEPDWDAADLKSAIPFGPYLAACYAVADIYLRARGAMIDDAASITYGWDAWEEHGAPSPSSDSQPTPDVDLSKVALAGVGAVGAAWMHAMYAYPGVTGGPAIADADVEGVSLSNLNRGALFTPDDVDSPKAEVAARAAAGRIAWRPYVGRYEDLQAAPDLLVSAVDTNRARDAIQNTYPPRIVGGSTLDLRAEVLSVGQPGVGACLRCFNRPEPVTPDDDIYERARHDPTAVLELAKQMSIDQREASAWVANPECGQISVEFMTGLREKLDDPEVPQFSVGFVSIAAGTLLAAKTVKVLAGYDMTGGASESTRIQFFQPAATAPVRLELRDSGCPKCAPGSVALERWSRRHEDHRFPKTDEAFE